MAFTTMNMLAVVVAYWSVIWLMVEHARRSGSDSHAERIAKGFIVWTMGWSVVFGLVGFIFGICVAMAGMGPGNEATAHTANQVMGWSAFTPALNWYVGWTLQYRLPSHTA